VAREVKAVSRTIAIEISDGLLELLGSAEEIKQEVKRSLVLSLVRKGKISRAKASELLDISLWDLPVLLSEYGIPWFDYSKEQMEQDMAALRGLDRPVEPHST